MNALQQAQERYDNALPPGFFDEVSLADRLDIETDNACELIGRAHRAFIAGNPMSARACADLLREAAEMLNTLADEVAQ